MFNNFSFRKSCSLCDNVEKYCGTGQVTDGNIIVRMRTACWITKATDTHSEYVIFIAFPLQQWLHQQVSILRYTYSAVPLVQSARTVLYRWYATSCICVTDAVRLADVYMT